MGGGGGLGWREAGGAGWAAAEWGVGGFAGSCSGGMLLHSKIVKRLISRFNYRVICSVMSFSCCLRVLGFGCGLAFGLCTDELSTGGLMKSTGNSKFLWSLSDNFKYWDVSVSVI